MPLGSVGFKTQLYLTPLGSRLGSARGSVRLGSALHDTTLFGARLGSSWLGSGLGPKLGSTRLSLGSGLCSGGWAGLKKGVDIWTSESQYIHGPSFLESKRCFHTLSMGSP